MMRALQIAVIALAAAGSAALPAAWSAGLFPAGGANESKEPIEIQSDRLVANNTEKWADFIGTVKATQGKFSMTSQVLRIYYEGDLVNLPKDRPVSDVISKLVATGKVRIVTEEYTADAERAEYVLATDELTLSGENSRVQSGKNTLAGPKIVFRRSEGKALVEGSATERVKAVFHPAPKGAEPAGGQRIPGQKDMPRSKSN